MQQNGWMQQFRSTDVSSAIKNRGMFVVAMSAMVFVAALLFVLRANRGFDLVDHDEMFLLGEAWEYQAGRPELRRMVGYPPGLFFLYNSLNSLASPDGSRLATQWVLFSSRFLTSSAALVAGVLAGACCYWVTRRRLAFFAAAAAWWWLHELYQQSTYAFSEPWQALSLGLSLALTWHGMRREQGIYFVGATLFSLIAVVFKYPAVPALGIGVGAALWYCVRNPARGIFTLVAQTVLIAICAYWLLFIYGAAGFSTVEAQTLTDTGLGFVLQPQRLAAVFGKTAYFLNLHPLIFYGVILLGSLELWRRRLVWQRVWWGLLCVTLLSFILITNGYWRYDFLLSRYLLPACYLGVVAFMISLIFVLEGAGRLLKPVMPPTIWIFGLLCLWLAPGFPGTVSSAYESTLPNTRNAALAWSGTSLPTEGTLMIDSQDYWYLSHDYAEYPVVRTWFVGALPEARLDVWRAMDIRYAYVTESQWAMLNDQPEWQEDRASLLTLKTFPDAEALTPWLGERVLMLLLWQPEHRLSVDFGDTIRLIGYDLLQDNRDNARFLRFRPYWQALQYPLRNYQMYLHWVRAGERTPLTQADGAPGLPLRPTMSWNDTTEILLGDWHDIMIPADNSDPHQLLVGLYELETGERLLTSDELDYFAVFQSAPG
jgi:hypothetical protein